MKTVTTVLALSGLLLALGCTPRVSEPPREVVYKNEVRESQSEYRLLLQRGQTALQAEDRRWLDAMAARLLGASEITVADVAAPQVRKEAVAHLKELGLPVRSSGSLNAPDDSPPEVIVQALQYAVVPPECGDWSLPGGTSHNDVTMSNLGCSNERALGLMVADPRDLVAPDRGLAPMDGVTAVGSIERYRAGELKPFPIGEQ